MISESDIYWLTRMDGLVSLAYALTILFASSACFFFYAALLMGEDRFPWMVKTGLVSVFLAFVFGIGGVFIPSTKELAAIKVIPMIVNNKELKGLGEDVVVLAREWITELKPKKSDVKAEKQ
jgi:hypothetical protein